MSNISNKLYSNMSFEEIVRVPVRKNLKTGINKIDRDFGFPSGFYVICGNPGTGKGFFALWLSKTFYELESMSSVYYSLEMPESLVRERVLQSWSNLTREDYLYKADVSKAVNLLSEDMFVVDTFHNDDQGLQTPDNFIASFEEYYELGYRIFHFDHLHEIDGANDTAKNQSVTEKWSKVFQEISKKYDDVWLFVYVQPNGAGASKMILRRTDISGSKAITQKCDFFISLNRKIEIDDRGMISVDNFNREIILFLDKTRYTSKAHIGFRLIFDLTGNFRDDEPEFEQTNRHNDS